MVLVHLGEIPAFEDAPMRTIGFVDGIPAVGHPANIRRIAGSSIEFGPCLS
jgi:hypothetical protein